MGSLKRIRPSNLIILASMPFILYIFLTSRDYQQSLRAIIGIEDGALILLRDFLLLLATFLCGAAWPFTLLLQAWHAASVTGAYIDTPTAQARRAMWRRITSLLAVANLILAPVIAWALWSDLAIVPLLNSVIANSVDPYTSSLIVKAELPRRLTPEALEMLQEVFATGLLILTGISLLLLVAITLLRDRARLIAAGILLGLNAVVLAYLLLVAHLGFAAGLFTSLRAAVFAYFLACALGLTWAGLLNVGPGRRTFVIFPAVVVALLAGAAFYLLQKPVDYVLIGSLEGRVAIVAGTPKPLIDT